MKDLFVPRMIVYYTCPTAVHAEHVLGHETPEPQPTHSSAPSSHAAPNCSFSITIFQYKRMLSLLIEVGGGGAGEKSAD